MSDISTIVDDYLAALTEGDPDERARLVERAWAPGGRFVDPLLEVTGHVELGEIAAAVRGQFPDHVFRRTSGVDAHHGYVRFTWALVGPDGAVAVSGVDVGVVTDDGRLNRIVGFFGDAPALDAAA